MSSKYLVKELIRTFDWSDNKEDRMVSSEEIINGRTYIKLGQKTTTTYIGNLYKIHDPSNESFKYLLLIGVARQHPNDCGINIEEGKSIANENSLINPVITMNLQTELLFDEFKTIVQVYNQTLNLQMVKTKEEIIETYRKTEYGKKYPTDAFLNSKYNR